MAASKCELIEQAVGGDREALAGLLRRHGPGVRASLTRELPKRWQSVLSLDDVMQEAYTDAILSICQLQSRDEPGFAAWLSTLARRDLRDAVDMLEADKRGGGWHRIGPGSADDSHVGLYELLGGTTSSPSSHAARNEACAALERAIGQLPAVYRQVVEMYDLECRPIDEVAAAVGRSPEAVYMLRARAHRWLHTFLGRTSKYFGDSS